MTPLRRALAAAVLSAALTSPHAVSDAAPAGERAVPLDLDASVLRWTGRKVTGSHTGTLRLKSGEARFTGDDLTGGRFEVDMTSLRNEDVTKPESNAKLTAYLKSDDFFATDRFPTALFAVTRVEALGGAPDGGATHRVTGDLTVKDITRPVTFPVVVRRADGRISARAAVTLDRTLWNIRYRSGKFFPALGDKLIHDEFTVELDLAGRP